MLQRPNGKCGAQFREDGSPDDIVSALQCPVVSHQQGVVERKGQSLGNKRSCTFDKKFRFPLRASLPFNILQNS